MTEQRPDDLFPSALADAPTGAARPMRAEAEQTFRAAFDQSPIATAILDQELRYSHVSAAWLLLLGFQREELLGKTPLDITPPTIAPPTSLWFRRCGPASFSPIRAKSALRG
jgi:PAS domain-containing protein